MPVVFEKLAAQLKVPVFREAESGYHPDDVQRFLDELAAQLAVLEAQVEDAEMQADRAERRLRKARKFARSNAALGVDTSVLEEVVVAGQRQAEHVIADAEAEVKRLAAAADSRVAAAVASIDQSALREEIEQRRAEVLRHQELAGSLGEDLDVAGRAVRSARGEILAGIDQHLRELAAMPRSLKEARL